MDSALAMDSASDKESDDQRQLTPREKAERLMKQLTLVGDWSHKLALLHASLAQPSRRSANNPELVKKLGEQIQDAKDMVKELKEQLQERMSATDSLKGDDDVAH
jgi:hypothetical protein